MDASTTFTDVTTGNMDSTKHGYIKKGTGVATDYMDGTGAWSSTTNLTVTNFSNATHTHANANNGNQLGRNALNFPAFPFVAPTPLVSGDFSWDNQGSATLDTSTLPYATLLKTPADASTGLHCRYKSAPGSTWTITALVVPFLSSSAFNQCGLLARKASNGSMVAYGLLSDPATFSFSQGWSAEKWTDSTHFSAAYAITDKYAVRYPINKAFFYMQLKDDGTNRKFLVSNDGLNFVEIHSIGRTDFLTADQVGFYVTSQNASFGAGIWMMSWLES